MTAAAVKAPTTRLGVLGWPVAHSRSPQMHNAALAHDGLAPGWRYQLLPVPPELFAETVRALPGAGFRGANVTIPHKEAALALSDSASARARAIGAANTLVFDDRGITADNTDAPGVIGALPFAMAGRTALVLGAGGSARAVIWALADAGADEVRVWNRTPVRAERLAAEFGARPVRAAEPADLLVNCTAVGLAVDTLTEAFNHLPLSADGVDTYDCVIDLVYADFDTPLVQAARERSVPVVTGDEVLIGQGALAYEQFTGRPAPVATMRAALTAAAATGAEAGAAAEAGR